MLFIELDLPAAGRGYRDDSRLPHAAFSVLFWLEVTDFALLFGFLFPILHFGSPLLGSLFIVLCQMAWNSNLMPSVNTKELQPRHRTKVRLFAVTATRDRRGRRRDSRSSLARVSASFGAVYLALDRPEFDLSGTEQANQPPLTSFFGLRWGP